MLVSFLIRAHFVFAIILSVALLLWRECKRNQDTDLGDFDCESAVVFAPKLPVATLELLRLGYYGKNRHDVLPELGDFLQPA